MPATLQAFVRVSRTALLSFSSLFVFRFTFSYAVFGQNRSEQKQR